MPHSSKILPSIVITMMMVVIGMLMQVWMGVKVWHVRVMNGDTMMMMGRTMMMTLRLLVRMQNFKNLPPPIGSTKVFVQFVK